ncbi:hypothetical protein [Bacillus pumilus]
MRSYINAKFSISQSTKDALHDDDKGNFGVVLHLTNRVKGKMLEMDES